MGGLLFAFGLLLNCYASPALCASAPSLSASGDPPSPHTCMTSRLGAPSASPRRSESRFREPRKSGCARAPAVPSLATYEGTSAVGARGVRGLPLRALQITSETAGLTARCGDEDWVGCLDSLDHEGIPRASAAGEPAGNDQRGLRHAKCRCEKGPLR